jgi:lipid II:glycine glycyltransferase (peptidoglycan interpeptide bridge formation enzyme)
LFLYRYELDRKEKKYFGRSAKFMRAEMSTALAYNEMVILWAVKDNRSVAAILVLIHGKSASYRLGWTTEPGRAACAHNVLLWEAVKLLKEKGIRYFDLVGVEPSTAEGLTQFKQGMGGSSFKTLGLFS